MNDFGKNFLPGPTDVHPEVLAAQVTPMFSHRGPRMHTLLEETQPSLQECFGTSEPVFIATCSASGLIEASVRSGVRKRMLVPVGGYFGEYFARIGEMCGKEVIRHPVPVGAAITPEQLDRLLDDAAVDAVALVHSESSTGALADIPAMAEVVRRRKDVLLMVDGVTSVGAMAIEMDRWGVDYYCTGSQKSMALPPGLAFGAASARFLERADRQPDAGFYLSVKKMVAIARDRLPFWTPAVSLIVALDCQVKRIAASGGWEARWQRHRTMQQQVERWIAGQPKLSLMAAPGRRSPAISAVKLPAGTGHLAVLAALFERGYLAGGPLESAHGSIVRIGHMGDLEPRHLEALLATLEEILG